MIFDTPQDRAYAADDRDRMWHAMPRPCGEIDEQLLRRLSGKSEDMAMEVGLCEKCGNEPIYIKKWRLGRKCYAARVGQLRHMGVSMKDEQGSFLVEYEGHLEFSATYFGHKPFIYRAATFRLGNSRTHTPSFYDVGRDTWIDVVRTRQAYHIAKDRYAELRQRFPNLKFELRKPDGALYDVSSQAPGKDQQREQESSDEQPAIQR